MQITSSANLKIKEIRKLRERKARQESGLFYVEGLRHVMEASQQQAGIETLVVAPELLTSTVGREFAAAQSRQGVPVLEVSAEVFAGLALKEGPQGLAAVVRQRWWGPETVRGGLWAALDSVADPGNLGTILRTLDAVGGEGVILLDHSTDPYDPTAVRASMGAVFTQKLVKMTFEAFAAWKQAGGLPVVGTSDHGPQDYHYQTYPEAMVLLMGSERQGLQPQHLALCDALVRIPMQGQCDSLNLAVAAAVVLYEIYNHRRDPQAGGLGGER